MRILYLDLDTLRPDHLGCYGYHRNTSPNIDRIASEGVRFTNCYASDAPCLPSRAALMNSRFGIHTGVVNHGGENADLRLEGRNRSFQHAWQRAPWPRQMLNHGLRTVSISGFIQRHSSYWYYNGFAEMYNTLKNGMESAEDVMPTTMDWLERNAETDNWFLQVNFWDPHTPYRAPETFGNPFENDPVADWVTEDMIKKHWDSYGPHSPQEPWGYGMEPKEHKAQYPRVPDKITNMADYKRWIDGYDCGIRYMDDNIGEILALLEKKGILDDTVIIVSADHGENQGELNVYGDHQTADEITNCIPLIVRWPGVSPKGVQHDGLMYNLDLPPTVMELLGGKSAPMWDGESMAAAVRGDQNVGRDYLVVSQCAWSCQRAVRWDNYILIRTYHDGLKNFPPVMLFDLDNDPHELNDLSEQLPDVTNKGLAMLERWTAEQMQTSDSAEDPLWRVIREGGPLHTRDDVARYCKRLRETGRAQHADHIESIHGKG